MSLGWQANTSAIRVISFLVHEKIDPVIIALR